MDAPSRHGPLKLHGHTLGLMRHWQALALPLEAAAWEDRRILEHWKVQQQKVVAFASGLHVRLGAASRVSLLNDVNDVTE